MSTLTMKHKVGSFEIFSFLFFSVRYGVFFFSVLSFEELFEILF